MLLLVPSGDVLICVRFLAQICRGGEWGLGGVISMQNCDLPLFTFWIYRLP